MSPLHSVEPHRRASQRNKNRSNGRVGYYKKDYMKYLTLSIRESPADERGFHNVLHQQSCCVWIGDN